MARDQKRKPLQVALIQAPTGYADGNGNWQQPRDQEQGRAVLRQARTAKGWVLRDLTSHGICFGTASHDENGLLNKDMNARSVARLLHVLQPLNPAIGSLWTLAAMKHLASAKQHTGTEA